MGSGTWGTWPARPVQAAVCGAGGSGCEEGGAPPFSLKLVSRMGGLGQARAAPGSADSTGKGFFAHPVPVLLILPASQFSPLSVTRWAAGTLFSGTF